MPLAVGTRLGPHGIIAQIGAGGMGESTERGMSGWVQAKRMAAARVMSENGAEITMRRCCRSIFRSADSGRLRAEKGAIAP